MCETGVRESWPSPGIDIAESADCVQPAEKPRCYCDQQLVGQLRPQNTGDNGRTALHHHRCNAEAPESLKEQFEIDKLRVLSTNSQHTGARFTEPLLTFQASLLRSDDERRGVPPLQQLRMHRRPELGIDDNRTRMLTGYVAYGQLGIIHEHRSDANENRRMHCPQSVRHYVGLITRNCRAGTNVRRDAAVDTLRVAKRNTGALRFSPLLIRMKHAGDAIYNLLATGRSLQASCVTAR